MDTPGPVEQQADAQGGSGERLSPAFGDDALKRPMNLQGNKLDVAIVGGGPGGLAAAHAILAARPDLRVAVFERSTLRPRGALVMVQPNGLAALGAINPSLQQAVLDLECLSPSLWTFGSNGSLLSSANNPDGPFTFIKEHGGDSSTCAWHELQAVLARALLPRVLHQGAAFGSLEEGAGGVTLHFQDGRPPVTACLVVGADGGQSAVRAQVLGDGPPLYMGTAVWRAVQPKPKWFPERQRRLYGTPPAWVLTMSDSNGAVYFQAFGPWPAERLDEIGGSGAAYVQDPVARQEQGEARRGRALEVFGTWCPEVRELIEGVDPLALTEHGQMYRPPEACKVWGRGRMTLLGDAAHLSTPFLAQGTSQAFQDALALGRAIGQHGTTPQALRAYETFRQRQMEVVHCASVHNFKEFAAGRAVPLDYEENHRLGVWKTQFAPLRPARSPEL